MSTARDNLDAHLARPPELVVDPVSTNPPPESGSVAPVRRSRKARRGVAAPLSSLRVLGRSAPVSMTVTLRYGSEPWVEVSDFRGRFWVRHDASLVDLIRKMQDGGYRVQEHKPSTRKRKG